MLFEGCSVSVPVLAVCHCEHSSHSEMGYVVTIWTCLPTADNLLWVVIATDLNCYANMLPVMFSLYVLSACDNGHLPCFEGWDWSFSIFEGTLCCNMKSSERTANAVRNEDWDRLALDSGDVCVAFPFHDTCTAIYFRCHHLVMSNIFKGREVT